MAEILTPNQVKQMRALAQAEAIGEAKAVTEFQLGYYSASVLSILQAFGLTGSKVKTAAAGSRCQHYWLTPAGIERLKVEV